jgi:hypothetical protein
MRAPREGSTRKAQEEGSPGSKGRGPRGDSPGKGWTCKGWGMARGPPRHLARGPPRHLARGPPRHLARVSRASRVCSGLQERSLGIGGSREWAPVLRPEERRCGVGTPRGRRGDAQRY